MPNMHSRDESDKHSIALPITHRTIIRCLAFSNLTLNRSTESFDNLGLPSIEVDSR